MSKAGLFPFFLTGEQNESEGYMGRAERRIKTDAVLIIDDEQGGRL
ncbi:MAG: hypothetical protein LBB90_09920 [Tannerella sp.]|nr:hypothetical protein [Tannerella sp.]